ncbi:FG-GAP-like repeat-containing protein [Pedobacter helvus]|uniref:FG-GAP-like repeat-containing protein n=1 Tax=Pedobacter helvus TaxID=2563444 RepID=A0ABW9JN28_9SPHI|nr:FG-GAP-like repeat-containing protein [Pedobacter ureilyticus]
MKIIPNHILRIQLITFFVCIWNFASANDILLHEKFNGKKEDLKGWKFVPDSSWSILPKVGPFGDGSLIVNGARNSNIKKYEVSFPVKINSGKEKTFRLSAWLKTENVNYRRDEIVAIQFKGAKYFQEIREFTRNSNYSYLEKLLKIPAHLSNATINIIFYGQNGAAYFDEIKLEDVTENDKSQLWNKSTTPFYVEKKSIPAPQIKWNADLPYRVTGKLDQDYSGDPVWTDLDFSRLLLATGELNPVDPSSVKLFAKYSNGKIEECPVSFGDPISKLSDRYLRNGTFKWRAKKGASSYEIYFASAGKNGPLPQQNNLHMGVGELLNYPAGDKNLLWAGWPGYGLEVLDVDGDGDYDIYGKTVDGGIWLHRNVGTNQSPLFLPRSRQLKTDKDTTEEAEDFSIDWDGDGNKDRVFYVKHPRSNRVDNIETSVYVQLHRNGKLSKEVILTYADGTPVRFINSSWFSMKTGDFNNDGKPDLVVGSTQGFAEILLNKGLNEKDRPVVTNEKLPLHVFKKQPYESGDMSLKPFPIDWDGDGRTDLVFTAWQGFYWISLNKGKKGEMKFDKPIELYQQGGVLVHNDSPAPYAVDWDNDGDLDIISGGCSGNLMYFENIAGKGNAPQFKAGVFLRDDNNERFFVNAVKEGGTVQGMEEQYWGYLTVVPADVDRDGDLDLIIADCLGKVRWIENIGNKSNPKLSRKIHDFIFNGKPLITPWRNRPGVADWNNDNRLELILLNDDSELVFYSQDAKNPSLLQLSGNLKDKNGKNILIKRPPSKVPGGNGRLQIDVADWDGDGNLDLVIGEPRMYLGGGNLTVCLNKGTNLNPVFEYGLLKARGGRFVEWTGSDGHDAWHCTYPCVVDWDNDGKPDIITGTESGRFAFYANDYFKGEKFPVFTAQEFDVREENKTFSRILDFKSLNPFTEALNTQNVQLQLLPEEANSNRNNVSGTLQITSPQKGAILSGKVKFIAGTTYSSPVSVDFYINNEKVATEISAPYVAFGDDSFWDTTKHPDGEYTLKVVLQLFDGRKVEVVQTNVIKNKK